MPSFDEIIQEAHRLAVESRMGAVASALSQGKHPGIDYRNQYEALIDQAYKSLCAEERGKEWEILRVTEPKQVQ